MLLLGAISENMEMCGVTLLLRLVNKGCFYGMSEKSLKEIPRDSTGDNIFIY
jgi:hypothetical protein